MTSAIETSERAFAEEIFNTIGAFSQDPVAGYSRQGYGKIENKAHDFFKKIGAELGLEERTDAAGNLYLTYPGTDRTLPALLSGSHADSVPEGGNFDGLAGIVAPLAVVRWMRENDIHLKRDFTVLVTRMEESSYFGKAYVGSLAMLGKLKPEDLRLKIRNGGEETLGDAIRGAGFDPEAMVTGVPLLDKSRVSAFVEVHIEQGPTLDAHAGKRVGIVTGIRGNLRHKRIECIGETAHSGAVDREYRHDAVLAVADFLMQMEKHWVHRIDRDEDLVFTSGVVRTSEDAAIAKVPGDVRFCVDMRSLSMGTLERFHEVMMLETERVSKSRGVKFEFGPLLRTESAHLNPRVVARLANTAARAKIGFVTMPSGAGHDAAVLANAGIPSGMIFVANQHGSHNPNESMKMEDFMTAVKLLSLFVTQYDEE